MAAAQGVLSMRVMQSRTLDATLQAFFPAEEDKAPPKSRLEQDFLELSPFSQVRQMVQSFRTSASTGAQVNVELTVPHEELPAEDPDNPLIDRDLDLMLRMLADDEEDYQRLRGRFEELMKIAREGMGHPKTQEGAAKPPPPKPASSAAQALEAHVSRESVAMRRRFQSIQVSVEKREEQVDIMAVRIKEADPLVLDLDGDGLELTKAGEGAIFDVNADGRLDQTAWVKGDDALLVLDRNGNGTIDDGGELFGEQHGARDGLQELAKFDSNQDGRITRTDPVFKALQLYRDLNGNGKVDKGELSSLQQHGIQSLNLHFMRDAAKVNGNSLLLKTTFEREDGSTGLMADVLFGYRDKA